MCCRLGWAGDYRVTPPSSNQSKGSLTIGSLFLQPDCGLRLVGLVAQGSIPWACVGLVVLFQVVLVRLVNLKLTGSTRSKKGGTMNKTYRLRLFFCSLLETVWAIETNIAAGALPA